MAIMPGAQYVNAAGTQLMTRYDIVCVHTIVGYAPAHAAHFSTKANGHITQSRDTKYRAAANLEGNYRVISIENEDHGTPYGNWNTADGHQVPGFTEQQKEAIANILVWCYRQHGIPLVLAPDSKPSSRGIAFHRQGCDGNYAGYAYGGRVYGGELWSSAAGKVCPGDRRITQLINEIIPRARVLAGLQSEGFFMALTSEQQTSMFNRVMGFLRQRWYVTNQDGSLTNVPQGTPNAVPATALDTLDGNHLVNLITAVQDDVDEIREGLTSPVVPELDYDLLADKVAQKLSVLRFEASSE